MRQSKLVHLFEMLIVCAVGLYLVINPGEAWRTAVLILGIALTACGAIAIIASLFMFRKEEQKKRAAGIVASGVFALAAGIVLLVLGPDRLGSILGKVAGVLIAFSGILNLVKAFDSKKAGSKGWPVLLALSVLTILLGVVVFIGLFGISAVHTIVVILGIVLMYNGVLGIIAAMGE